MINMTSPVTGSAQTGLTSPTYTLTTDVSPDVNAKQSAVTALGGTQTGVVSHSAANPFTITWWRPKALRVLQFVSGATSLLGKAPVNTYSLITRKGVIVAAGQPAQLMIIRSTIDVPAGADVNDVNSIRAALSLHLGALAQQSAGLGDTAVTGIL